MRRCTESISKAAEHEVSAAGGCHLGGWEVWWQRAYALNPCAWAHLRAPALAVYASWSWLPDFAGHQSSHLSNGGDDISVHLGLLGTLQHRSCVVCCWSWLWTSKSLLSGRFLSLFIPLSRVYQSPTDSFPPELFRGWVIVLPRRGIRHMSKGSPTCEGAGQVTANQMAV